MQLRVIDDLDEWNAYVAGELVRKLKARPALRLCLPTGATPQAIYARLVAAVAAGTVSLREAQVFLLDEFGGVPVDAAGRCDVMLRRALLDHVDLPPARYHRPVPEAADLEAMCADYDRAIGDGLDLTLLGIGTNGHIGMNEPGSFYDSATRRVDLASSTTQAAVRYFGDVPPPTWGVTIGVGPLRASREIWLLAAGAGKADIVRDVLLLPVSAERPASLLRTHPNCTFFLDGAAASRLPRDLVARSRVGAGPGFAGGSGQGGSG
jgi:glucosamine-6-phosphate deaminase